MGIPVRRYEEAQDQPWSLDQVAARIAAALAGVAAGRAVGIGSTHPGGSRLGSQIMPGVQPERTEAIPHL